MIRTLPCVVVVLFGVYIHTTGIAFVEDSMMVPQEIENTITTRSSNSTSGYVPPKLKAVSEISADLCSQQHWSQELNHESSPCVLQQRSRKGLLTQWNSIEPSKEGNSDML